MQWCLSELDGLAGAIGGCHSYLLLSVLFRNLPEDHTKNQHNSYLVEKVADNERNGIKALLHGH